MDLSFVRYFIRSYCEALGVNWSMLQEEVDGSIKHYVLEILDQTSVWIAGVDPSSFDFKNPVYEQDLLKKLDLPFWPDLLTRIWKQKRGCLSRAAGLKHRKGGSRGRGWL